MGGDFDDDEPTPITDPGDTKRQALRAELWAKKAELEEKMCFAVNRDLRRQLAEVIADKRKLTRRCEELAEQVLKLKRQVAQKGKAR